MINTDALFSDETELFKTPYQPCAGERVTLRIRTLGNDALKVFAVINGLKRRMKKIPRQSREENSVRGDIFFDFYEYSFKCPEKRVRYYFIISDEDDTVYFNRIGWAKSEQREYDFSFVPGFSVPEWARGAVFYQIFPDRFCNGEPKNDVCDAEYYYTGGHVRHIADWDKFPEQLDVGCFYGGDLQGVRQKLDYLQNLGVEAIYFNPLFVSPSNHKYDVQDYDYIDPHLAVIEEDVEHKMQYWEKHNGFAPKYIKRTLSKVNLEKSNAYFCGLAEEIHRRGMKVIIDGVFNHCGSFGKWMDREGIYLNKDGYEKGAYQSVKSPYRGYFKFDDPDEAHSGYEEWWNNPTLPKLNYENSKELENYMISVGKKWTCAPFNADGWRLDVAADLGHSEKYNHKFWKKFRDGVRAANPQAFVFAEHYGSPARWLDGGEWDSVMNYDAFMEPVSWFLTGMEKHSHAFDGEKLGDGNAFFDTIFKKMAAFQRPALDSALNQLSNHDHSRFLTRTNRTVGTTGTKGPQAAGENVDKRVMELAVLIQMTWPGSPGVYYADEAGQVGWTDPDSRRTYPWGREDKGLIEFHRQAIKLRKIIKCLKTGSIMRLAAGAGYIIYGRFDGEECCAVAVNCSDRAMDLNAPVWRLGVPRNGAKMTRKFFCAEMSLDLKEEYADVFNGRMFINLPACSGCVFYYRFPKE